MQSYKDSAVSCWWDVISCPIPVNCSPSVVVKNIREALRREGHVGRICIQAYGMPDDLPLSVKLVLQGVSNGYDTGIELLEKMVGWAPFNPPPASVLLISGSNIFRYALEKFSSHGYKIMVVKPRSDFESNPHDPWLWKTWETLSMGKDNLFPVANSIFDKNSLCFVEEIFHHLHLLFGSDQPSFTPTKGKPSVVVIFRDGGSETTNTSLNYASYYQKMGLNPTIVCADTSSVVDTLSRNAELAGIPFFGIHTESDIVPIVDQVKRYIESCRNEHDLIIADISVCFKLKEAVRERVNCVSKALEPDFVLFAVQIPYMVDVYGSSVVAGVVLNIEENIENKGREFLYDIIPVRKRIVFIQRGNKFAAFDLEQIILLILGACNSTLLVTDYALGVMLSYCDELQERFCPKHFEIAHDVLVAELGSPDAIITSNKILKAAYRIWSLTNSVYGKRDEEKNRKNKNKLKTSCCDCRRLIWKDGLEGIGV